MPGATSPPPPAGEPREVERIVEMLGAAGDLPADVEIDRDRVRPVEQPVMYGSAARLREAIGWAPEIPLERTTADLLAWWRAKLRAP